MAPRAKIGRPFIARSALSLVSYEQAITAMMVTHGVSEAAALATTLKPAAPNEGIKRLTAGETQSEFKTRVEDAPFNLNATASQIAWVHALTLDPIE